MPKKITIRGFIGWDEAATPEFLSRELAAANGEEVEIEIASGGGFVFAGLEMANLVRNYEGRTVARVTGLSASMASYIPMMADEMIVEDNAVFMVHNVSTVAWGDFRDLAKAAKHIEGLRDVLAKAYVSKTGKSLSVVQELMDNETFLYGDEIVNEGFADSVIHVSTDGDDKDTAVILAMEEVANITAKMKENEAALKDDWNKAAAYFKQPENKVTQPPASAGTTQKEEATKMNLQEFLAANPAEKVVYEQALASARTEGETAGKDDMKKVIASASPYLANKAYPTLASLALKVITGEESATTLTVSVTAIDALTEQKEEKGAGEETDETGETQGQGGSGSDAEAQANYSDRKSRVGGL